MILDNGLLKLLDFGLAKQDMVSTLYTNANVGTSSYKAPELFSGASNDSGSANYTVDLWALGVLIYYMIAGELPFGENEKELMQKVIQGDYIPIEEPYELRQLIG
jgi:serine/threonine protein kinase